MKTPPDCELGEVLANHGVILTVDLKRGLRDRSLLEGRSRKLCARPIFFARSARQAGEWSVALHAIPQTHLRKLHHMPTTAKERINVFIEPAQRHQLDAIAAETGQPLAEIVRELLAISLPHLQHEVRNWTNPKASLPSDSSSER